MVSLLPSALSSMTLTLVKGAGGTPIRLVCLMFVGQKSPAVVLRRPLAVQGPGVLVPVLLGWPWPPGEGGAAGCPCCEALLLPFSLTTVLWEDGVSPMSVSPQRHQLSPPQV